MEDHGRHQANRTAPTRSADRSSQAGRVGLPGEPRGTRAAPAMPPAPERLVLDAGGRCHLGRQGCLGLGELHPGDSEAAADEIVGLPAPGGHAVEEDDAALLGLEQLHPRAYRRYRHASPARQREAQRKTDTDRRSAAESSCTTRMRCPDDEPLQDRGRSGGVRW